MVRMFVQFYSKIFNSHPRYSMNLYEVCNGLSDTLDLCKIMGEVIWIEHHLQEGTYGESHFSNSYTEFPYKVDELYISAFYISQLYQAYLWAKQMPETKVIVGGPVALPRMFIQTGDLPDNLLIIDKSVEEYFGVPNFSCKWKLEIPQIEKDKQYALAYTYTIDTRCYWGKCVFCNHSSKARKRETLNLNDFPQFDGTQRINIYSPAVGSNDLREILSKLKSHERIRYDLYSRSTNIEREIWKNYVKILPYKRNPPHLKVTLGVEFASERMLRLMKKGFTKKDIMSLLDIIGGGKNIIVELPYILGWNNLVPNDIKELAQFMDDTKHFKRIVSNLNNLFIKPYTPIYDKYEPLTESHFGPFYCGFYPKLNNEQLKLNKEAHDILMTKSPGTVFDYYGE